MMKRTALIKNKTVFNVVMAGNGFQPPKGCIAVETESAGIGDRYDNKNGFVASPAKLSKSMLIESAKRQFSVAMAAGIEFNLSDPEEPPEVVRIPADAAMRADIAALVHAGADKKLLYLVTKDRVLALTSDQIAQIHDAVMRRVAEAHARLAAIIQGIENESVASLEGIGGI